VIYWKLFIEFLKVGLFSFGGAYGAIPLIRDTVLSNGWMNDDSLAYMIAVSESTPGPIMVNLATFVGNSQAGILGAVIATVAVALPSFIIIILILLILNKLLKKPYVQAALQGIKPCIIGIILATGAFMIIQQWFPIQQEQSVDLTAIVITVFLAALYFGSKKLKFKCLKNGISPIGIIGISALTGVIVFGIK